MLAAKQKKTQSNGLISIENCASTQLFQVQCEKNWLWTKVYIETQHHQDSKRPEGYGTYVQKCMIEFYNQLTQSH